jgi:hypothetical protein
MGVRGRQNIGLTERSHLASPATVAGTANARRFILSLPKDHDLGYGHVTVIVT